jgi:hypothetical protein
MRIEALKFKKQTPDYTILDCNQSLYVEVRAAHNYNSQAREEGTTLDVMTGKGSVTAGDKTLEFEAPCVVNIPGGNDIKVHAEADLQIVERNYSPPHQWDFKIKPTMGLSVKEGQQTFRCGATVPFAMFEGHDPDFREWPVWFQTITKGHVYEPAAIPNGICLWRVRAA